jgi:hypothetical protein
MAVVGQVKIDNSWGGIRTANACSEALDVSERPFSADKFNVGFLGLAFIWTMNR